MEWVLLRFRLWSFMPWSGVRHISHVHVGGMSLHVTEALSSSRAAKKNAIGSTSSKETKRRKRFFATIRSRSRMRGRAGNSNSDGGGGGGGGSGGSSSKSISPNEGITKKDLIVRRIAGSRSSNGDESGSTSHTDRHGIKNTGARHSFKERDQQHDSMARKDYSSGSKEWLADWRRGAAPTTARGEEEELWFPSGSGGNANHNGGMERGGDFERTSPNARKNSWVHQGRRESTTLPRSLPVEVGSGGWGGDGYEWERVAQATMESMLGRGFADKYQVRVYDMACSDGEYFQKLVYFQSIGPNAPSLPSPGAHILILVVSGMPISR